MQKTSAWPLSLVYAALIVFASLFPFDGWRAQGIADRSQQQGQQGNDKEPESAHGHTLLHRSPPRVDLSQQPRPFGDLPPGAAAGSE